ncbi:hypothetical protein ALO91_200097 [Pseudomonas syringae pv. aceris]|uniref:Uncharacterized protein n=1 Tax=Pseudomonas syringae pv. aceris TaxID=199198 RepID=A0A0P9H269_PSESX|nr:hypothetical protein ALO91_200097 [Pseudomonas syringae pv. aceris]
MATSTFLLPVRVNRDPRFGTVVVIATFGPEHQTSFVYGVRARALTGRVAQFILPAVNLTFPNQYDAITVFLVARSPLRGGRA